MKLTKRELIAVSALAVVLVSFGLFKFIIIPQRDKVEDLKSTRAEKLLQLKTLKAEAASNDKLYVELLQREDEVNEKADSFFRTLNQEDIILLIQQFSKQSGLEIPNISFPESRIEQVEVSDKKEKNENDNEAENKEEAEESEETSESEDEEDKPKVDLVIHSADLEYVGSYYPLVDFLKFISSNEKKILVKDIKVAKNEEGSLTGNIVLDFYSIEKILEDEDDIYSWEPNLETVEGDPFTQFIEYEKKKAEEERQQKSQEEAEKKASETPSASEAQKTEGSSVKENSVTESKPKDTNVSNTEPKKSNEVAKTPTSTPNNVPKPSESGKDSNTNKDKGNNSDKKPSEGNANNSNKDEDKKPVSLNKTIEKFDSLDNVFFIGNNKDIIGNLSLNKTNKLEGESSLSLRYDFVEKRRQNIGNLAFNNQMIIREQPRGISLSVHPVDKSKGMLKMVMRDREGNEYEFNLADDLNWDGWKTVSVALPIDINYPATVERIYIETLDFYEKVTGEILLDDLKLIYDK